MEAWQKIETAPKDGTHILVALSSERYYLSPPTVVHWFDGVPEDGGWYLSVCDYGDHRALKPEWWMPLPPQDTMWQSSVASEDARWTLPCASYVAGHGRCSRCKWSRVEHPRAHQRQCPGCDGGCESCRAYSHICGDPNDACDAECAERAALPRSAHTGGEAEDLLVQAGRDLVKGGAGPIEVANMISEYLAPQPAPQAEPLSFALLRSINAQRCVEGFRHTLDSWSPAEWTNALCGEAGEAANVAKKMLRHRDGVAGNTGEDKSLEKLREKLGRELADVVIYADLTATSQGLDLGELVRETFNRKSEEIGAKERL